ncbi:MAG: hypothetical protein AB7W59_03335 [Acidimicrobiia bacterium]
MLTIARPLSTREFVRFEDLMDRFDELQSAEDAMTDVEGRRRYRDAARQARPGWVLVAAGRLLDRTGRWVAPGVPVEPFTLPDWYPAADIAAQLTTPAVPVEAADLTVDGGRYRRRALVEWPSV